MTETEKCSILELQKEELADFIESISEPRFRTRQLLEWIFQNKAESYAEMQNIPKSLREKLAGKFSLRTLSEAKHLISSDKMTEKWLFETSQKHGIESVLIREEKRRTACISCSLGCPLNCRFCASAEGEFLGDLTAAEMVEQVMLIEKAAEDRISNVVFMGTGEPFLNYDNVLKAARIINSPDGLGIGARHITISTSGIITGIERFSAEPEDFRLAVSLHAANQKAREKIIPSAKKWKLNRLISAIRRYSRATKREVTFEYILIEGFNCHEKDAFELCELVKGIPCKINCIPFNPVKLKEGEAWKAPDKDACRDFINIIKETGIRATLRQEKGSDIAAACGQLRASKNISKEDKKMLNTAIKAAKAAGEIQKKHFGEILQVDEKDRFDIKLQVDKLCEEKIIDIISAEFPEHAILGEESGASGESDNCWVIDPLDGTVNFFYGLPAFCCSIGLEVKGKPYIGVIYNPCCDELFTAEIGKGAFLNGKRIKVSDIAEVDQCMVAIGFMKDENTVTAAVEAIERSIRDIFKIRCMGSAALDMAYIAAGRFTGYYECGIRNWDISAGKALLLEAGGKFIEKRIDDTTVNIFAGNKNAFDKMTPYFPIEI